MSIVRVIKKFNYILTRHQKIRIFELTILMIIGGFLETLSVSLIMPFMNSVMRPEEIMEKWYAQIVCDIFHIDSSNDFLIIMSIVLALIYIIKNAYLVFEYNVQYSFGYSNMFCMQKKLLQSYINRPYEFFLGVNSGEIIRIINNDTSSAFFLLITLLAMFTEIVVSVMIVGTLFIIAPATTLFIILLMLFLLTLINRFIKPILRKASLENQRAQSEMNKWLLQSIQGIKELKVMNKENFFQDKFTCFGNIYVKTLRINQLMNFAPRFFIEAVSMGSIFIVVSIMIYNGNDLQSIIPMLTAVAMAAIRLLPSVNRISSSMASVTYNEAMLDKMLENLTYMEDLSTKHGNEFFPNKESKEILGIQKEIEFRNISFHYPDSDMYVLENVNMKVCKGESIGIVGVSGAGKSTVVDIILGLLHQQEGEVLIDGIDIRNNIKGWHTHIGYIPQFIFMLDDSIRANIAFGENKGAVNDDEVWRSLQEASLFEFVRSLPQGLDTQIGERGIRLSGGQKQRIGIARALYRNPEIMIFDEATSALDNETEAAIMESINQLHGQKTMIIIAHRLTTIKSCDHVFRVENRNIIRER